MRSETRGGSRTGHIDQGQRLLQFAPLIFAEGFLYTPLLSFYPLSTYCWQGASPVNPLGNPAQYLVPALHSSRVDSVFELEASIYHRRSGGCSAPVEFPTLFCHFPMALGFYSR